MRISLYRAMTAGVIGLGIALPSSAVGGLFTPDPVGDVRGLLARMPAPAWTADLAGFFVIDIARLRDSLGLTWPDAWPERGEGGALMQVYSHMPMMPRALARLRFDLRVDPLAEIGASTLDVDGVAEIGVFTVDNEVTVLFGDDLADPGRIAAAIVPLSESSQEIDGPRVWTVHGSEAPDALRGSRLAISPPNLLGFVGDDFPVAPFSDALAGDGPILADLLQVTALLDAVDGPSWPEDGLIAVWGGHPGSLSSLRDGWPADSALPEYEVFAIALRHDAGEAVGLLALVYDDVEAAAQAVVEMSARAPRIAEMARIEPGAVTVAVSADNRLTVLIEARGPLPATERDVRNSPFVAWTTRMLHLGDFRPILP